MKTITPRTATEALRYANTVERAHQIIEAGYTFWKDAEIDSVAVCKPGRFAASYFIGDGQCDCMDFAKHGDYCKHTVAVDLKEAEEADLIAKYEAQYRDCELETTGIDPYSRY